MDAIVYGLVPGVSQDSHTRKRKDIVLILCHEMEDTPEVWCELDKPMICGQVEDLSIQSFGSVPQKHQK